MGTTKIHGNRKLRYCPQCGRVVVKAGHNADGKQAWECPLRHSTVHPRESNRRYSMKAA